MVNWGGLLRQLAARRALDLLRRRRAASVAAAAVGAVARHAAAPASTDPQAAAVVAEQADALRRALAELPAREAEVFSLRHFGDLSNADVAATLRITPNAAAALSKARARLRAALEQPEED